MQSPQASDPGQGDKIGPYRLEEKLGAGGMGAVWRAWDERLKRPVAMKRILPEALGNPTARARFRREAEAEASLNHPAIVHIYDILETDQGDWIVMELIEGEPLSRVLQSNPLEVPRAIRLGREIAEGLAQAHAHGIIHRDLKASNVMVTTNGHAKILDFGIAKHVQPEAQETTISQPGLVVGTSYAMSPEQIQGLPLDLRSDLFSLGSLLYEMVTGVAPFRAETATATLARVCSFRQVPAWQRRPSVPRELANLIDRLLEKDPIHRPQNAGEVVRALEGLQSAVPTSSGTATHFAAPDPDLAGPETILDRPAPGAPEALLPESVDRPYRSREAPRLRSWAVVVGLLAVLALAVSYLLQQRLILSDDPPALYEAGMERLARYDKKGNVDEAIDLFQRILARNDSHAPAYAGLARAYWLKYVGESKDQLWLERALPMAQRAVELDEYLAVGHVSLGLVHSSQGHHDLAERELKQALLLDPLNAYAHFGLGWNYEAQSRLQEAETAYKKAIAAEPDRAFYDQLGLLYLRTGRSHEAVEASRKSIALAPDSFIGYRNLGVAYYMQGKLGQAAKQFQKGLEIQPEATLYTNLGNIYFAQGFYPQSASAFEKALEMPGGANNYYFWGNLGDAYRWTPDSQEEARQAYLRAIQLLRERLATAPSDGTLRSRLALYLAKRGDRSAALADAAAVESLPEQDAYTLFRLATVYEVCGNRDKALAALGRALQAGFSMEEAQRDPELLRLREDPRYHRLISQLQRPGSADGG